MFKMFFSLALPLLSAAPELWSLPLEREERINVKNEPVQSKTFAVSDFSGITTQTAIEVEIRKAQRSGVEVHSNVLPYVVAEVQGGRLSLAYKNQVALKNAQTKVIVYTKEFDYLSAHSAGKIKVADSFYLDRLTLEVHSAGLITQQKLCSVQRLMIDVSSAGEVKGVSVAEHLEIKASSAAKVDLEIQSRFVSVDASSAASVLLSGTATQFTAEASSLARIKAERLQLKEVGRISESSGGRVQR